MIASCAHPASLTASNHFRPSGPHGCRRLDFARPIGQCPVCGNRRSRKTCYVVEDLYHWSARWPQRVSCHRSRVSACRLARPQIGVTHLHQTRQTLFLTAFEHHLHLFVLHSPGHIVGDAPLSMQLYGRDNFLVWVRR